MSIVSTGEAAKILHCTRGWILKLVKTGKIRAIDTAPGMHLRINLAEIKRYARDNDMEFLVKDDTNDENADL
jgi:excisionase family DNA binding protein